MRELVNPVWTLFDAAARHWNVQLDCPACGHSVIYHAAALWWMFERKGWSDDLRTVRRRFHCHCCKAKQGRRERPKGRLVKRQETQRLPLPSKADWKRAVSRRR